MKKAAALVIFLSAMAYAFYQGDTASGDAAIAVRRADAAALKAISSKSLDQSLAFYAPDAIMTGSAMSPARGLVEVRAALIKLFAEPDFALTWKAERVGVTASHSIAYSSGTWNNGKQHGPYLTVWRKQPNGAWKIIIDSAWLSSD